MLAFTSVLLCDVRRFHVDERSGAVSVAVDADRNSSSLDRESNAVVDVLIAATDGLNHSSTALLTVRLADRNDNRPMFTTTPRQNYVGVIDENSPAWIVPVTVTVRHAHTRRCTRNLS